MAFGTKTNERPGTRAQLRYARFSAFKAREVLDLIRNKPVGEARDILQFTERGAAEPIMKLLDSAVANAANNDGIAAEELYVSACFADEGPTLKRFRPRARGRASRIRKRTCHVTIIVSRYSATELDAIRERLARKGAAGAPATAAQSRARRVAKSRQRSGEDTAAAAATSEVAEDDELPTDETVSAEGEASEATETDVEATETVEAAAEAPEAEASEAGESTTESDRSADEAEGES